MISFENDMSAFTYRFHYGKKFQMPVYCWYIEGGDQHILVDTGADAETALNFRGVPAKEIATFEQALAGLGLKPEDIDIVIQTHLQWDHCVHTALRIKHLADLLIPVHDPSFLDVQSVP